VRRAVTLAQIPGAPAAALPALSPLPILRASEKATAAARRRPDRVEKGVTAMLLEGQVAIVSGIGPGLGRAIALRLAQEGADLALAARTQRNLEEVAAEVEALGRRALIVPTDIGKKEDAKNLADRTHERFGRIDVLVNNAFADGPYVHVVDMDDAQIEAWERCIHVNLNGTMYMCRYVAPYMKAAKRGSIVNITSLSMRKGIQRRSAYSAAKAGITLMTQCLADELGQDGVRVNCVAPGHMWSDKLKNFYELRAQMFNRTFEEQYNVYASEIALKRIPEEEEVAGAVLFMASDLSSCITGASLDANGGHYFH
jgi:NAD(P)-dependent dehydrogenase (short-subunit alcohol dehydrogenase family)